MYNTVKSVVDSPAKSNFKMAEPFYSHLQKPSKSSPFAQIILAGKSSHSLHNLSTASTTHTSHLGSSFTESTVSSGGGSKTAAGAYDRMTDFCDYNNDTTSSPACGGLTEGVVGLSALSNGITEFAKNNKNMQPKPKRMSSKPSSSSASSSGENNGVLSEELQSDVMMLLGHDESFISSISATSSPRSFCRENETERQSDLLHIMADEDSEEENGTGSEDKSVDNLLLPHPECSTDVDGKARRGTAIQLFQATPPCSPGAPHTHKHAPASPTKVAAAGALSYSSLSSLNTPAAQKMGLLSSLSENHHGHTQTAATALFLPSTYNDDSRPLIPSAPAVKNMKVKDLENSTCATRGGKIFTHGMEAATATISRTLSSLQV